jgi:hypothetical protein
MLPISYYDALVVTRASYVLEADANTAASSSSSSAGDGAPYGMNEEPMVVPPAHVQISFGHYCMARIVDTSREGTLW